MRAGPHVSKLALDCCCVLGICGIWKFMIVMGMVGSRVSASGAVNLMRSPPYSLSPLCPSLCCNRSILRSQSTRKGMWCNRKWIRPLYFLVCLPFVKRSRAHPSILASSFSAPDRPPDPPTKSPQPPPTLTPPIETPNENFAVDTSVPRLRKLRCYCRRETVEQA